MKDDLVAVFQRLLQAHTEIWIRGETADRLLNVARLSLALGNPDQAHDACQAVLYKVQATDVQEAEARWIKVLALCLRAAIWEGTAEGAPGWRMERKLDDRALCRTQAKEILAEMSCIAPLGPQQSTLLRALDADEPLYLLEKIIHQVAGPGGREDEKT